MPTNVQALQEHLTTLSPDEVLASAKVFFPRRNGIYAAFLDKEGPNYATFRGQGGEEIVIAAQPVDAGTHVTGSSYLFDMQIGRFFATLPSVEAPATMPGLTAGDTAESAASTPTGAAR